MIRVYVTRNLCFELFIDLSLAVIVLEKCQKYFYSERDEFPSFNLN